MLPYPCTMYQYHAGYFSREKANRFMKLQKQMEHTLPCHLMDKTAKSHEIKYFISYTGAAAKLEHRTPHSPSGLPGWHAISLKTARGKRWRSNALHSGWLWLKKEEEERIKPAPLTADGSAPCSNVLWQSVTPHFSIPITCHLVLHSLWDQESSHSISLCCEISPSSEEKESTVKYVRTANAAFFYVIRW